MSAESDSDLAPLKQVCSLDPNHLVERVRHEQRNARDWNSFLDDGSKLNVVIDQLVSDELSLLKSAGMQHSRKGLHARIVRIGPLGTDATPTCTSGDQPRTRHDQALRRHSHRRRHTSCHPSTSFVSDVLT